MAIFEDCSYKVRHTHAKLRDGILKKEKKVLEGRRAVSPVVSTFAMRLIDYHFGPVLVVLAYLHACYWCTCSALLTQ